MAHASRQAVATGADTGDRRLAASVALAGAVLVMGGQFAIAKRGLAAGLTPWDIVALRFAAAAAVGAGVFATRGLATLAGIGWGRGSVLALVAGSPYAVLIYAALRFAPAAHAAMLIPGIGLVVATVIGAAWVGERHDAARCAGVGLVLAGLAVLGARGGGGRDGVMAGDAMLALAGMSWGFFTLLVRRWRLEALPATAALSLVSLAYLPVYAVALEPRLLDAPLGAVLLQAGYQGVLQTLLAFAGYAYAVRRLGAGTAAIASAAVPVLGTLVAIPLAGEWPVPSTWLGLAVVCAGIGVANAGWRPAR